MPIILATQEAEIRRTEVQAAQTDSSGDPFSKNPSQKRAGGMVQVVEHLPSKHEALSSKAVTTKKKRRKVCGTMTAC
jgi:hypothetical protein